VLAQAGGLNPIVVHGGGPQIDRRAHAAGQEGHLIQGMRVTDEETMEVVEWCSPARCSRTSSGLINAGGGKAVGLTGATGG